MSYCLNPNCCQPQNQAILSFCPSCGFNLLLKDRYRAIQLIGQGGFGRTFLAVDEHKPSKPRCVVKQFFPQASGRRNLQKAIKLFEQEAVRLDELGQHPQIPQLLAHFTQENHQYLVQEFIEGQNLEEELTTQGPWKETQIWELLHSLLPVLDFIHSHQIIHRDIKPENIIRCSYSSPIPEKSWLYGGQVREGQLVLVDFGAAKFATGTALNRKGTAIGSAGYAAPEQTVGKAVFASDLYCLGVTCVHLLTQVHPFDLYSVSSANWVWRDYLNSPISNRLSHILDKLLKPATSQRYQSALAVLQDLEPETNVAPNLYLASPQLITAQTVTKSVSPWQCVKTLTGHLSSVCSVAISADGKILASGSFDRTIKLWNLETGELLHTLNRHSQPVLSLAFSPNSQILASGSVNDTIDLWNLSSGVVSCTIADHSDSVVSISVAISPDGQVLASGSDRHRVKLWQIESGKLLNVLEHSRGINTVTFSQDGQILASGSSDNTIKLWQLKTSQLIGTLVGHHRDVNSVAISPNSKILASGSGDNTIKLWNLQKGKLLNTLMGHTDWVRAVAFCPRGKFLVSGSADGTVRLWQTTTGEVLHTLLGHSKDVNSIALDPDGKTIVSGSRDGTIKIWRCQ